MTEYSLLAAAMAAAASDVSDCATAAAAASDGDVPAAGDGGSSSRSCLVATQESTRAAVQGVRGLGLLAGLAGVRCLCLLL